MKEMFVPLFPVWMVSGFCMMPERFSSATFMLNTGDAGWFTLVLQSWHLIAVVTTVTVGPVAVVLVFVGPVSAVGASRSAGYMIAKIVSTCLCAACSMLLAAVGVSII